MQNNEHMGNICFVSSHSGQKGPSAQKQPKLPICSSLFWTRFVMPFSIFAGKM